jgi:GT2 family glycosyltransferase
VFGAGTKIASGEDSDFLYRAHKKGLKIRYYPDVLVYHDHGRKADSDVNALLRGYGCGRGAFYCKHILLGDRIVMRMALREVILTIRLLIKNLRAGHSIERQRIGNGSCGLLMGVIRGLPIFLRRAVASR